jgi:hypothetical protein
MTSLGECEVIWGLVGRERIGDGLKQEDGYWGTKSNWESVRLEKD